ncbi:hypothetical protein PF010_g15287 [Phytophthora fragariae]|uniref:Uncharacterized protein n=1 Tax=Phytophthora fragariae TaxID=53985 RepID=A0A6G0KUM9_9STRA|nr:hypothetical protein PF010_g15287 [Phytophthora fragariae]
MPPVNANPIYIDPSTKTTASTKDIEGFDLWLKFSTVVMLQESGRFRRDPEWGEGCRLAQLGQWMPAFIALINSRIMEQPHGQEEETGAENELEHERQWTMQPQPTLRSQIAHGSVFVTPENATRLAVNNAFVAETALLLPIDTQPQVWPRRVAPYLDLIDGMAVQVTQNVETIKGVANGTLGTLEHVHFPPDTTYRLVRDGASRMVVRLPDRPPELAILRVPRPHAVAIRAGVDPELFPVFFATEAYAKATISLPRAPNGQRRSITVRPQQLPFVCAVGSTIYKGWIF